MGKISEVDIKGHRYRYHYNEESGSTEYLGPVGSAPAISEADFHKLFTTSRLVKEKLSEYKRFRRKYMVVDAEGEDVWDEFQGEAVPYTKRLEMIIEGDFQREIMWHPEMSIQIDEDAMKTERERWHPDLEKDGKKAFRIQAPFKVWFGKHGPELLAEGHFDAVGDDTDDEVIWFHYEIDEFYVD
jgi:hypothetical protein